MAAAMGGCLQDLGQWASLHLPRALLAVQDEAAHLSPNAAAASPPPLPPPQPLPGPSPSSGSFRPSVAVVVGVLTTMFSITFLLLLYAKHCRRTVGAGRPYGGASGFFGMGAASLGRRNSGVDRAVVESLPVFRFGSLRGGRKEGVECAVCLGRFRAEELLRLLPKCRHAFHVECVDTWLDAHSTCPICRHRVDPEDVLLAFHDLEPPAGPKPHPAAAPADPEEVLLGSAAGAPSPAGGLVGFLWGGRRLSGRHSSAGEKHSDSALQVVVQWAGPDGRAQRSSVDNAVMLRGAAAMAATKASAGRFDGPGGVRKDVLLLAESAEDTQRRSVNRLVVSGDGDTEGSGAAMPRRWSDMRPQDLQHLRRDMVLSDGGRASSCSSSGGEAGVTGARSVSEITGLSRFAARRAGGAGAGGRAEEERVLRRWLSLASRRAGRWLGLREEPGGSGR